jgi:hypothetical protein
MSAVPTIRSIALIATAPDVSNVTVCAAPLPSKDSTALMLKEPAPKKVNVSLPTVPTTESMEWIATTLAVSSVTTVSSAMW